MPTGRPFPPGDTPFARREGRNRCLWREQALLLHLLQQAVNLPLGLQEGLHNWAAISLDLREPPRKRALQVNQFERHIRTVS